MPNFNKSIGVVQLLLQGEDYEIAGGFARDKFNGLEPKDIDVWVADLTGRTTERIKGRLEDLNITFEEHDQYDSDDHDRRNRIAVFTLPDYKVDIITSHETPLQSIQNFDFNLNQYLYNPATELVSFVGTVDPSKGLVQEHEDVSPERVLRMKRKWREIYG